VPNLLTTATSSRSRVNRIKVELLVKLPDTDTATFGCFQNFIFTGAVYDKDRWKGYPGLPSSYGCLEAGDPFENGSLAPSLFLMSWAERRQLTSHIPGTPLLIQAWQETEEGSGLRK